jgi:2-polyprenyl-3-methyl-5-hydroxy-6-metoxy-1,4-benzoquinol methylase
LAVGAKPDTREQIMDHFSVKDNLRELILKSLSTNYISESCKDSIQTENHYQSVTLENTRTAGVRTYRGGFLDQLDLQGKKVLDLGSNLGEMSRAARARGAYLVDGFEYDQYFVDIANLVNAFNRTTRVSFYQRDITEASAYGEHYDVVLAFSVFIYIRPVLQQIARVTDHLLILETHKLEDNLDSYYLEPVSEYFPHHKILGESEWATRHDASAKRAIIAFAKEESALAAAFKVPLIKTEAARKSSPIVGRATQSSNPDVARYLDIDVDRTNLQKRFFSTFLFDSSEELLAAVAGMHVDLHTIAQSRDSKEYGADGWVYWLLFTKGYLQYAETGAIGPGNVYYDYLVNFYLQQGHNPSMRSHLSASHMATERVARRFRDCDLFRNHTTQGPDSALDVAPIRVTVSDPPAKLAYQFYETGSDTPLAITAIDGWHRLFSSRLYGIEKLRCEVVPEHLHSKPIRGAIEHFSFDGRRLVIRGWWLKADEPIYNFEVRVGATTVARNIPLTQRIDVKELFEEIPHAQNSGFFVECEHNSPADVPIRFDIIGMQDILPVGVMAAYYLPGMFGEREWPPASLTQRVLNESEPAELASRSVKCLNDMLTPIQRHRSLDSFVSVLDWGVGCGLLQFFLPHFLLNASVTGIDVDKQAVEWCQQSELSGEFIAVESMPPTSLASDYFDLVLSYSALTRLTRNAQAAWLSEIHRVMNSRGYLAVGVYGELMRPFLASPEILSELASSGISDRAHDSRSNSASEAVHDRATYQTKAYTVQEYSKWFEVVDYIEGGINDLLDLVIMRKA